MLCFINFMGYIFYEHFIFLFIVSHLGVAHGHESGLINQIVKYMFFYMLHRKKCSQ